MALSSADVAAMKRFDPIYDATQSMSYCGTFLCCNIFVAGINSTKDKDEWLLCVVVENRALHSEVQSPLI